MRKSFLLPLKFLLFFIISAAVFCLFTLIFNWGQNFSRAADGNSLLLFLSSAAGNVIFPSASAALIFSAFDYRKNSLGFLPVILLTASVLVVLFFGFRLTSNLAPPAGSASIQPFSSGKIHTVNEMLIYTEKAGEKSTAAVEGIIIRNSESSLPGFNYFDTGRVEMTPELKLVIEDHEPVEILPANPVYDHIFKPSELLGGYLADINYCNSIFISAAKDNKLSLLLLTAAVTAFLMICLLFKGITVWPLFEIILIIFFHRVVFFIIRLFTSETAFISETFFGGKPVANIPLFTILALSVVLLLCGLLLRTTNRLRTR